MCEQRQQIPQGEYPQTEVKTRRLHKKAWQMNGTAAALQRQHCCISGSQKMLQLRLQALWPRNWSRKVGGTVKSSVPARTARHYHVRYIHRSRLRYYPPRPRFWELCCMTTTLQITRPRKNTNTSEIRLLESSLLSPFPISGRQQGEINSIMVYVKEP